MKARVVRGVVAGWLVLVGAVAPATAGPTVAQMLSIFKPKQEGVVCTTPSPEEQKTCKVELVTGRRSGSSGWLLRDKDGRPLRRFFDTNGDKKIDVWSYYLDGVEVYREVDTAGTGTPNQYRWLNTAGSKWGVDEDKDGKIESWKVISAAEACQEAFQALAANNLDRFKALLITDAEIQALRLPAKDAERLRDSVAKAAARFQATAAKIPARAQWGGLEDVVPQCIPSDMLGTAQDLLKYPSRTMRYDHGDKQHEWLQTGEMIQVGTAWRLTDAPVPGDGTADREGTGTTGKVDPVVQKLLTKLAELDAGAPQASANPGPNAKVRSYHLERAALIEQIASKVKTEEREQWVKQLADSLSAAAQNSPEKDRDSLERLTRLKEQVAKDSAGSPVAAYVTFREMWAEFSPKLAGDNRKQFAKAQAEWQEKLKKFVQDYPRAEDTPDALLQLAMGSDFDGKDRDARKWYQLLARFENHPLAPKVRGALRRLELDGKEMELSGPTLDGSTFDLSRSSGKVIVVYYWASYCPQCAGDFAKLKLMLANHTGKVELVGVNLDETKEEALKYLKDVSIPAVHLYQPGGLNSPLATQYGIMGLPNLILIGKDHKVVSRTTPINDLDDEVKKQLK